MPPPTIPINHYLSCRNQANKADVLFHFLFHANVFKPQACLKHSNLFKANVPNTAPHSRVQIRSSGRCQSWTKWHSEGRPVILNRNPTTSLLTTTTLIYTIAGITAAAGTKLAFQLILMKRFKFFSFQLLQSMDALYCCFLSQDPCQDWIICAPAALLRCGSRFSSSLQNKTLIFCYPSLLR